MILIHSGFTIDHTASAGEYIYLTSGMLIDDNNNNVYYVDAPYFRKPLSSEMYVYYNVLSNIFEFYITEIPPQDLDLSKSNLLPLCFIKTDSNRVTLELRVISYGDGVDPVEGEVINTFKTLVFKTENIGINNGILTLEKEPIIIISLYIKDKGFILNTNITTDTNICTLSEPVTGDVEIIYGYYSV